MKLQSASIHRPKMNFKLAIYFLFIAKCSIIAKVDGLNCYECTPNSGTGGANNCHIDGAVFGKLSPCADQNSICYKETKVNPEGDTLYVRGCTKRTVNHDSQVNIHDMAYCDTLGNSNGYTNVQRCFCYDNECNGSESLKHISFWSACILSSVMYFISA